MAEASLLERLEAVTARLEAVAGRMGRGGGGGGGGADDDDELPPYITDFQTILTEKLPPIIAACDALPTGKGGNCGDAIKPAFDAMLAFFLKVPKSKKPGQSDFIAHGSICQGVKKKLEAIDRKDKNFSIHKPIYLALNGCADLCQNLPLELASDKSIATVMKGLVDPINTGAFGAKKLEKEVYVKFFSVWDSFTKSLLEFSQTYKGDLKMGFSFKPNGVDFSAASGTAPAGGAGATTTTPAAEESKEAPTTTTKATGGAGGGGNMASVFGQLNQGLAVTGGLKKVKKEQKTKYRKDRSGKVEMKTPVKKKGKNEKEKPPSSCALSGNTLKIDYHSDNTQVDFLSEAKITGNKITQRVSAAIYRGDNSLYNLSDYKFKSVSIDSCNKCRIYIGECVSIVEAVNCKSVTIILMKSIPSITVEKSDSPKIIVTQEAFASPPNIITSRVSAMNIEIPGATEDADPIDIPIPEQFISVIDCKSRTISTTEVTHG